jgi:hypothetical protein
MTMSHQAGDNGFFFSDYHAQTPAPITSLGASSPPSPMRSPSAIQSQPGLFDRLRSGFGQVTQFGQSVSQAGQNSIFGPLGSLLAGGFQDVFVPGEQELSRVMTQAAQDARARGANPFGQIAASTRAGGQVELPWGARGLAEGIIGGAVLGPMARSAAQLGPFRFAGRGESTLAKLTGLNEAGSRFMETHGATIADAARRLREFHAFNIEMTRPKHPTELRHLRRVRERGTAGQLRAGGPLESRRSMPTETTAPRVVYGDIVTAALRRLNRMAALEEGL